MKTFYTHMSVYTHSNHDIIYDLKLKKFYSKYGWKF